LQERESSLDVVQSVLRDVLGDLGRFEYRGVNSFRNWLLTYADNKLRNRVQFHRAARRAPDRESDASLSQFYGSICSPSRALAAKEQVSQFERAFAQLSETDQQIIVLARIEALSHAQIAERLGTTQAASKKALSRAVVRLANRMAPAP
jgi:RNA polymerase sigma factor (sigma-70 family)